MTSSALAGERRWGSARRGSMTVLGKVAVPKPLNLPSQRLENHGLDPNVEIVPKGTLSWGTNSSSTNVWGTSSADKANSPSHLSGRPSSGGSGTRPSTAGSDKVNETGGSAWGPNSRPSSASGILSSDQSSLTYLRPHSAEPRPASSHLSRFAEPVSDTQGAWGASGTSDRFGMAPSKKEDFSLSSGDFPTLGAEKDQSSNISESKDPGSRAIRSPASGGEALMKDEMDVAFDRSKRDGSGNVGEGLQPSMENWQAEHQQYYNPNIPPQHFDAWRGPPMNAPPGGWYRGPQGGPAGPPFGPPVGPGGFPIEPFPYYPPQIPPPAFSNSQPVPQPRGGPRGHQPNSGNPYRHKIHDGFMHPGMPYRPGFYPPPMAFDGYYGPPRGYCNPNEPDIPFMNMGANHPVYDGRYPAPNAPGPSDSHARAGGPGHAGKKKSDDVDIFHSGDSRMPSKFLSKRQGEWDGKEQAENREHNPPALALHPVKAEKTAVKPRKYEWGAEDDGDDIYSSAQFGGGDNYVPQTVRAKASQSSEKPTEDYGIKKFKSVSASPIESAPKEFESPFPSTTKDATLMRKIEGLNAKVRSSDGRADSSSVREDQKYGLDAAIGKVDTFPHNYGNAAPMERNSISEASFSHEVVGPRDNSMVHQIAAPMSRRSYHGMSNRSDHGGKGKFGNQPADGWQRRPPAADIPNVMSSKAESDNNFLEVAEIHQPSKDEGRFNTKLQEAQRAKNREIAKQRAMQLQKEEEERIRDQKAKAQAKLEDLNRRTQAGDASNPVAKKHVSSETSQEQQEVRDVEYSESVMNVDSPIVVIQLKTEGALAHDEKKKQVVGSAIISKVVPVETSKVNESAETLPLKQDVVNASIPDGKSSSELDEGFVSRNKSTSFKKKQNNTAVKNYNENSISVDPREGRRLPTDTSVKECEPVASSEDRSGNQPYLTNNCNTVLLSSVAQRTSSRNFKSKNKQDDGPLVSTAVATAPTQILPSKSTQKIMMPQAPSLQLSFGTIQVAVSGESGLGMSDQPSSLLSEDTHGKVNSQLKPQHTRRPRSQQGNNKLRTNDAAVWAPVRSQNKVDVSEEATAKGDLKQGPGSGTSAKNDNLVHSSSRSKRAEMERYVPKPVAKELAEQVGMQPILSSVGTSTPKDTPSVQPVDLATVDSGSSVESGQGQVKHNKPGKTHGAWRQRVPTEVSHAKNIRQRQSSSDPSKSSLEDASRNQSNPEPDQLQAVTKTMSEMDDSGSKIASLSSIVPAPETHHGRKDAVITGKGKHSSYGGHKKSGNGQNNDDRNISNAESDRSRIQSPCPDINQPERATTPKENLATSERPPSHWQPKAYAYSVGQKGSRITGNHSGGGEGSQVNKKDYPLQQQRETSPRHYESNEIDGSHSEVVSKAEGNHEPRRGRKLTSSKYSNENPVDEFESSVADAQHVQQLPLGSKRNVNQVNRSGRGHESHGDLSAQGNRQHDRTRHMHYEYQPVGSLDYKKNNFEGQGDGIRNAGSRNRGRGHNHPRRGGGNFQVPRSEHLQVATD